MTKYFIKDGYGDKGPFTIEEIKKLKISKTTFVRKENSDNWIQADSLQDLKRVFETDFRTLKILLTIIFIFAAVACIIIGVSSIDLGTSYSSSDESVEDIVLEEPLPEPPSIYYTVSKHEKRFLKDLFKDCNLSGYRRQLIEACDYSNSLVRNTTVSIAGQNSGTYNLGQICDIFDYCYRNWHYVNDPVTNEIVEYASNTIQNGLNGDCDDFAVLICSMILSIGGEARINFAYGPSGGHAFTEVNIGQTDVQEYISKRYKEVYNNDGIWTRLDNEGNHWLNLDWFASHPGGNYFDFTRGTTYYIIHGHCIDFRN